jgi:hypothetical protein
MNCWISKASATQRAGRTGRMRPGTVYRLYSAALYNKLAVRIQMPLNVYMSFIYVYICIYMYVFLHIFIDICTYICISSHLCIFIHIYLYVCI